MLKARVVGNDDKKAGGFLEGADDFVVPPLENADDPAPGPFGLGPPTASGEGRALKPGNHEIPVKGGGGVLGIDPKILSLPFGGSDEGESLGVKLDGSGDEIGETGGDPMVVPDAGDTPLLFQVGEGAADRGGWGPEPSGEGGDIERSGFFALKKCKNPVRQAAGGRHGR